MSLIYEPGGKAGEYSGLAVNLYVGCPFGCTYCYGPGAAHVTKENYHNAPRLKKDVLAKLAVEAKKMAGDPREILLSFLTDPYFSEEAAAMTREALIILGENELKATVLTKAGTRAERDFDVLEKYGFSFGTSLVWMDDSDRLRWEPQAAPVWRRVDAIRKADKRGIRTWVSLEPVVDPDEALAVIAELHCRVDHWKVGKLNGMPEVEKLVDWAKFHRDVVGLLEELGADYYIKKSLGKFK